MTTFGELIDQTITTLHGHSTDQPALGTLVGDITATSTELALDFGDQPGASRPNGAIEIGRELIAISRYDATTGIATLAPWGRGQRGTTAVTHDAGDMVTVRPRYPRSHVANVLNQVIQAVCPPLYAPVDLPPFDTDALVGLGYPLPDDTLRVLRVEATDSGIAEELADRRVLRNWTVRNVAGTQLLEVDRHETFQTIQVTVAASPTRLVYDSDEFIESGLPEYLVDLIQFGAIARLVLGGELARQQVTSVEANTRNDKVPAGSGTTISRYYQALFTQRLEAERDRLQSLYPLQLLRRG